MVEALETVSLGPHVEVRTADDVAAAAQSGWSWARPEGVVLLSPAAPSFDRYSDYRAKGLAFAAAVAACRA